MRHAWGHKLQGFNSSDPSVYFLFSDLNEDTKTGVLNIKRVREAEIMACSGLRLPTKI